MTHSRLSLLITVWIAHFHGNYPSLYIQRHLYQVKSVAVRILPLSILCVLIAHFGLVQPFFAGMRQLASEGWISFQL
ncbi:hypothetical protein EDD37DRAFT_496554 [Exophiala viscosa]|uniref:Uncharacterized protein n=1 Tax=Exophiala viscosa TaxID=2486360 RepID=A0AAN6E256_9EURO|nr:hypothetical protein EDD36DRAFT_193949 [Exophiala viscosa]KAI1621810.1 hypothetical protein EDD37DRAFT_496554 [Exophiala viscosa]